MVGGCRFAQAWVAAGCACAGPSWTEWGTLARLDKKHASCTYTANSHVFN